MTTEVTCRLDRQESRSPQGIHTANPLSRLRGPGRGGVLGDRNQITATTRCETTIGLHVEHGDIAQETIRWQGCDAQVRRPAIESVIDGRHDVACDSGDSDARFVF